MNALIVWDKKNKKFINRGVAIGTELMSDKQIIIFDGYDNYFSKDISDFEIFNYIGKTDINDKNIYADCSIVEFTNDLLGNGVGYFSYCLDDLGYFIKVIRCENYFIGNNQKVPYYGSDMKNLKIIGTLQEDKHLLLDNYDV